MRPDWDGREIPAFRCFLFCTKNSTLNIGGTLLLGCRGAQTRLRRSVPNIYISVGMYQIDLIPSFTPAGSSTYTKNFKNLHKNLTSSLFRSYRSVAALSKSE